MNNVNQISKLASKYGYAKYMIERYLKLFGLNETEELLEANEKKIKKSIRINSNKVNVAALINRMEKKGFRFEKIPWDPNGFYVRREPYSIGASVEYLLGYYFIEKAASMIPPNLLNPNENDLILDMCSAPGGKLVQLADLMNNEGCIIGIDSNRSRIRSLRSNIMRMGVSNAILYRMDASNFSNFGIKVDKILLDAPCTGEGLIAFDKKRKTSRKYEDILFCSNIQVKLLEEAVKCVKINGIIVYSTCSIAPEENELVIDQVLNNGNLKILELGLDFGDPGMTEFFGNKVDKGLLKARRFYPHKTGTQGFFICKLQKLGEIDA